MEMKTVKEVLILTDYLCVASNVYTGRKNTDLKKLLLNIV